MSATRQRWLAWAAVASLLGLSALTLPVAYGFNTSHDCANCHSAHTAPGTSLTNDVDVEVLCMSCHGPEGTATLVEVHTNKRVDRPYPLFRSTCVDCHDPHSDMPNWLAGTNIRLVGTNADGTGIARIDTTYSGVREVVFESRGTDAGQPSLHSFADGDQDGNGYYDGLCETCHTQTTHHRNSTSGGDHTHHVGETCTRCHVHSNGFKK